MLQWHVRQIKADRRRVERFKRHLVDGFRAGSRVKVDRCINVSSGVISQRKRQGFACELGRTQNLNIVMVIPDAYDYWRMIGVHIGLVVQFATKVDEFHGRYTFWIDRGIVEADSRHINMVAHIVERHQS